VTAMFLFPEDARRSSRDGWRLLAWIAAAAALWLAYILVFVGTSSTPLGDAIVAGAANVAPLIALALAAHAILLVQVMRRAPPVQAVLHPILAIAFALTWYAAVVVLLAVTGALRGRGFHLIGFSGPALTWQVFQGLILYGAVAAGSYALRRGEVRPPTSGGEAAPRPLERYLVREGEGFRPVEVSDIVTIASAQDYSEVSTPTGRHLVRMSLGEFEARLDPGRFIRVHRSAIIHLAHLERAEPAGGGRMLAHMADGQRIPVSRAGVKALRPLIV
jgi:two-component system LytT family response regulator